MLPSRAHRSRVVLLVSLALPVAACAGTPTPAEVNEARAAIARALDAKRPAFVAEDGDRGQQVWKEVRRFYKANGDQLVWSDGRRPRSAFDELLGALRAADAEGLEPGDYRVDELDAARQTFDRARAADVDVRCTYAYLSYATDLTHGTVDPEHIVPQWHAAPRDIDLHGVLQNAVAENRIAESLDRLAPRASQYQGLKHQLAIQRQKGDAAGVDKIAMNMERWRWLPDDLGARYLVVNIPAFRLDTIENGKSVLGMKVVTGKKANPTPMLTDEVTSVVFSPYWNIPPDIVEKEILPRLDTDPSYLERNNIEVDESGERYRQRPGKGNSLGQVKFAFPNHYNVYLHGTPSQQLFDRVERDFSHGCVRLERPLDLAKYVLRDQPDWTEARIVAAMDSGTEQSVKLKQPLPIYLVYFTAWEEGGALRTVPDVYGLDRRHGVAAAGP